MVDGGVDDDTLQSPMQLSAQQLRVVAVLTASTSAFPGPVQAVGRRHHQGHRTGVTSASLKAGVGNDLMSITGGITDGSLFGGTENDSFDFTGGRVGVSTPEQVLTLLS